MLVLNCNHYFFELIFLNLFPFLFSALKLWNTFLTEEINEERIKHGVFKPTQHYLNHIPFMIRKQGVLKSYSAFSMERSIGVIKRVLKSRSSVAANAGNILERSTLYNYIISSNINVKEKINLLAPRNYSTDTFIALDLENQNSAQLWGSPLEAASFSNLPFSITSAKLVVALQRFYKRIDFTFSLLNLESLIVAGRCWFEDSIYVSRLYREHIGERRRGNNYIMFKIPHKT